VIAPKAQILLYRDLEILSVLLIGVIDRCQFAQSKQPAEFEGIRVVILVSAAADQRIVPRITHGRFGCMQAQNPGDPAANEDSFTAKYLDRTGNAVTLSISATSKSKTPR